ncbi:MAG TPA: ABC transporter ATP-binding protein, partial [Firmicutes bacterium]|nr:ABC transporter ATP-binding protein [Bacillota bacterium]
MAAVVRMEGIVKRFPGICANDHVDLEVQEGEILALLGENGAGKSTLMKILYGVYEPQEGDIYVRGRKVQIRCPEDAIRQGIWMIHQQFMLVPPLTVLENVVAGLQDGSPWLRMSPAREKVKALGRDHGLFVDPDAPVWQLSVGEQQRVEIIKALFRGVQILVMDEPTAVLTPQETEQLFAILRSLRTEGKTIIFISHKLEEVMAVSDRVTVLRAGKVVATVPTAQTTPRELARMMVGREVLLRVEKEPQEPGPVVLELEDIHALGDDLLPALRGVSLQLRAGEILGIAGVDGNGQVELTEVVCGLRPLSRGRIRLEGRDVTRQTPHQALCCGIAHIPSDRQTCGSIPDFSVQDNFVLDCYCRPPFARGILLNRAKVAEHAHRLISEYDIRVADPAMPAGLLSGGNLQKVIIA